MSYYKIFQMSVLQEILRNKRLELEASKSSIPLAELRARAGDIETTSSFKQAIKRDNGPVNLIAELKKTSPSKGLIRADFNLAEIVSVFNAREVSAISVLTESQFFGGSLALLNETREKTEKPLLRKDFIFDEYQVYEARANNADAILLITAALERSQLSDLYGLAKEISLDCLVEVHNLKELDSALYCDVDILGVNNRNLSTLDINLDITFELLKEIPEEKIVVSESGINTRTDVESIESTRVDAILVGTAIMKERDIGTKIDELMGHS